MDPGLVRLTCLFQRVMLFVLLGFVSKLGGGGVIRIYNTHACIQMW